MIDGFADVRPWSDTLRRGGPLSTAEAAAAIGELDSGAVRDLLNDLVRAGLVLAERETARARMGRPLPYNLPYDTADCTSWLTPRMTCGSL